MANKASDAGRLVDLLHLPPEAMSAGRLVVFNAPAFYRPPAGFAGELALVQPFRPLYLALQSSGHPVSPQPEGGDFDVALVALGRHRGENERMLADAAGRLKRGGLLVAAGFKSDGAASLRKRLSASISHIEHAAKHHGVVFWFRPDETAREVLAEMAAAGDSGGPEGFLTAPGMFSADRIDPASRLLLEALPDDLSGVVADLGAGWGYLAAGLAARFAAVRHVDLYEADHAALSAARANMEKLAPATGAGFFWHDVRREPIAQRYDAVVMNPPFHEGRAAEPEIGRDFVRAARAILKPRGRLFMVANRGLPYEAELAGFAASGELVRDARYKVLSAKR